jgi:hypothetical protein
VCVGYDTHAFMCIGVAHFQFTMHLLHYTTHTQAVVRFFSEHRKEQQASQLQMCICAGGHSSLCMVDGRRACVRMYVCMCVLIQKFMQVFVSVLHVFIYVSEVCIYTVYVCMHVQAPFAWICAT